MLSNLSLFYQELLLIAFNSTLIAELFPHKDDNIIRGLGAPGDELAVNCENNDIPSEDWAHV